MRCGKKMVDPTVVQTNIGSGPDSKWKPRRLNLARNVLKRLTEAFPLKMLLLAVGA